MPEVLKQKPNTFLLVVGEFYDDPKPYIDLIEILSLSENVIVVNEFVPNEQVEKYYRISDLIVLPYRSATQSGILNVAYGFNKPVLVTDVGGLAEFVKEAVTGYIVEPHDPQKIAEGIIRFFNDKITIKFEEQIVNTK
jgi:glycosyltransferase involved in cell wall biosynthesis